MSRPAHHDPGAVLAFIIEHKRSSDGNSPTIRQIAAQFSTSTSHARYLLAGLARRGAIRYIEGESRGIQVVGGQWTYTGPAPNDAHLCVGVRVAGGDD